MNRRAVLAFCATGLVAAGLAPAASAGHLPTLAGETVVTVGRAAKMRISVPRRAHIAIDTKRSVDVDGGGRIAGIVLRENHPQGETASFVRMPEQLGSVVYGSGPAAATTGCENPVPVVPYTDCSNMKGPAHYDLRKGTYTLYAFSEGNVPATITLRVLNYPGSTVLDPATPVASGSVPMTTSTTAPVAWSAGAGVRTTGAADLFTLAWWRSDESVTAQSGACWYDGSEGVEAAGTYRWVPGCPGASSVGGGEVRNPAYGAWGPAKAGRHGMLGTTSTDSAGTYGLGAWTMAQGVRDTGGFAYWLAR